MKHYFTIAILGTALMGLPILTGCDKGENVVEKKTVTQNPDGSTTTSKEKSDIDPKTGNGTVSIEKKKTGAAGQSAVTAYSTSFEVIFIGDPL